MKTVTMYLRASNAYSWQEGYDPEFPYKIEPSLNGEKYTASWPVHSYELEIPDMGFTVTHVVECQLMSLEEVLRQRRAEHMKELALIETQIAELRCLPSPGDE